jgi:Ser/Thr protein kinase RdoA (MazF antagonist)
VVDDALFAAMVDDPIARVQQAPSPALHVSRDAEACTRLRAELREELLGRTVPAGLVHGDLWLGNILVDARSGSVCGIIDWDLAHEPGLVHADVMHLLLATRAAQANMEMGEVVVRTLASDEWAPHERAALDGTAGLGACSLATRTLLLLAWLAHVSGLPEKSVRYKKSLVWRARNTELVLEQL